MMYRRQFVREIQRKPQIIKILAEDPECFLAQPYSYVIVMPSRVKGSRESREIDGRTAKTETKS